MPQQCDDLEAVRTLVTTVEKYSKTDKRELFDGKINFMKLFFTVITFLFLQFTSNAQWEWQNGLPPRQTISKIHCIGNSTVFAVGEKGLIIKSTDRGITWFAQSSNTELALRNIKFLNIESGFAVGDSGLILKTTDGGKNWIKKEIDVKSVLKSIFIMDQENIWACGDTGKIVHSTDGGESWEIQYFGTSVSFQGIHFSNINEGCAIKYDGIKYEGSVIYTSDGGDSWDSTFIGDYITAMDFIDDTIGYASGYNRGKLFYSSFIWQTFDGGKTWTNLPSLGFDTVIRDIKFVSKEIGFAVGYISAAGIEFSTIYKTINAGISWQQVLQGPTPVKMNSISFNSVNAGIAVDSRGQMYNSSDLGNKWEPMSTDKFFGYLYSSYFIDENNGWTVGSSLTGISDGVALKTTNGGINWSESIKLANTQLFKVFFANTFHGWICGYAGALYQTSNGGETWINSSLDSSGTIWDIFFANENTGWIVHGIKLKKTTNGGKTWNIQKEFAYPPGNIFFVDENFGWIPYDAGKILKTTNGGIDWIETTTSPGYTINSIFFVK